jgi:hypothetical protein
LTNASHFASAISSRRVVVLSDGTPWRPLINVKDMARAIEWAIGRDPDAGGHFLIVNAGTDAWNYQVYELAEVVAGAMPGTEVSINRQAPPDKRSYRVDFSLFETLAPSHRPQADLLGTVDVLRGGLEAIGFQDPDFRNSSFMRLQVLADLTSRGLLNAKLEWIDKPSASMGDFSLRTSRSRSLPSGAGLGVSLSGHDSTRGR